MTMHPSRRNDFQTSQLPIYLKMHPLGFGTSTSPLVHSLEERCHQPLECDDPQPWTRVRAVGWGVVACVMLSLVLVPLSLSSSGKEADPQIAKNHIGVSAHNRPAQRK
jgi:hypothetical protein